MARRINLGKFAMRTPVVIPEPLVGLHLGNPSRGPGDEMEEGKEDEDTKAEGEVGSYVGIKSLSTKEVVQVVTPYNKLVPNLTVDNEKEIYSSDPTTTFRERKRLKGRKLYGDYAMEETIALSSRDEDHMDLPNGLGQIPPPL